METTNHKLSLPASIQGFNLLTPAVRFGRYLILIAAFSCFMNPHQYSQSCYHPEVEAIISKVSIESLSLINRELTGDTTCIIGTDTRRIISRFWKSEGNRLAAEYLYEKFKSFGYQTEYWQFTQTGVNVLGIKPGYRYPNQKIIFCCHYDDYVSGIIPDTTHGADDNASGTSAVLEAARILKDYELPYTIIFAAWDEEEYGLFGSDAYADSCKRQGDSIIAVINLDMIAWDSNNDGILRVGSDSSSASLSELMFSAVRIYQPGLNPERSGAGSDEISFQRRGYKGVLLIEDGYPGFNLNYHTVNDNFQNLNKPYFQSLTRAAIACLLVIERDYIINFEHTPLTSTNDTSARIAEFVITSSFGISGAGNSPRLYYKVEGGNFNSVTAFYNNLDTFRFLIPGHPLKTKLSYYIAAQDSLGNMMGSLPAGGRGFDPPGTVPPAEFFYYYIFDQSSQCSNTVPRMLPFQTIVYDSVMIPNRGLILDLDVNLSVNHTNDQDLYIWLIRGGIPMHLLSKENGGEGDNYTNTTFDDEAELSIKEGTAPFTGHFKPEVELSAFDYTELQGLWRLRILNLSTVVQGELLSWCVNFQYFDPIAVENNHVPVKMKLSQNYPNPFNASTNISYSLIKQSGVRISIFDVLGREVKTLVNTKLPAGEYVLSFNANDMASGLYFYSMIIDGNLFETKKMVLVK
jgi:subtilisin-like proprotein convertase family protein